MRGLLSLLFMLLGYIASASAQIAISGTICTKEGGEAVADVNVMLQNSNRTLLYGYAITDANGRYSLSYSGDATTLEVVITGFNIKSTSKAIEAKSQRVDFEVEYSALEIREVVVNAESVTRQSDTLTYNVATFINVTDRSIGDVLRKMPGLSVGEAGDIKYNGIAISKLYIEGMDMLGGKYGVATNNIEAKDIARVELYENHEHIKALRGISMPKAAAINLRLKEASKGTWNGTAQLGGGYSPWMWNGELSAMYFGKRFQTISIYKTNNTGDDVSREFMSHYGGFGGVSSMLGVRYPTAPNITLSRYLDNNIHAATLNAIAKLNDNLELSLNVGYIHDLQQADGASQTTYYLPDAEPLVIAENTKVSHLIDRCDITLNLHSNTEKHYMEERLSFGGIWSRDYGTVDSSGERVSQYFKLPKISINNNFNNIRRWDRFVLNFNSDINYDTQPAQLEVHPMLYGDIVGGGEEYPNAIQTLCGQRLVANNYLTTSYKLQRWNFMLSAQLCGDVEHMESSLNGINDKGEIQASSPELQNDILYTRLDFVLTPSLQYNVGSKLTIQADVPLDAMWLYAEDRINHMVTTNKTQVLCQPSLSINSSITSDLKLSARASYNEYYGSLYDSYGGYIMTDYRVTQRKAGDSHNTRSQTYNVELSYGNAIDAIFAGLEANYFDSRSNIMYNTNFCGSLSQIEAIKMPNRNNGYNVKCNFSTRISAAATTINLAGGYMQSWSEVLREMALLPSAYSLITAEVGLNTRITKAIRIDYTAVYNRSISTIAHSDTSTIDLLKQRGDIDFIIAQKVICRIGAEHLLNTAISGANRNTLFVDASLRIKHRRVEYSVEARNVLNNSVFINATNSNSMDYLYSYALRRASVVFKVRFSFK